MSVARPPMSTIEFAGRAIRVNQSKPRAHPDPWHDVNIPGLEGRAMVQSKDVLASHEDQALSLIHI
eukprot:7058782-Prorocentrum_lima.AAC.1